MEKTWVGSGIRSIWVQISPVLLSSCMILGKPVDTCAIYDMGLIIPVSHGCWNNESE